MPRSPHLPDSRDLTDDTRPEWGRRFRRVLEAIFMCASLGSILLGAMTIWNVRRESPFPPLVHGLAGGALVLVTLLAALMSARRWGRDSVMVVAVGAPVVGWLLVSSFVVVVRHL